jgi:lipopolysaccharide transport system ATP-binding protein
MTDLAIRVENLSKQYKIGRARQRHNTLRDALTDAFRRKGANGATETFWALKDVSFEVKRGEVVGIIGRNGAGKSTLLKILSQITEPTSGRAEIHGRVGSLLEVGTGFHPELTGRENIYLNGAILGMRREEIRRAFDEIVAFAEIDKFLDTPVKRYSSGMYVRLAFAVAAHLEPEILLVDEVLAVGDAAFQKKALGKMGAVVNEGRTVVFVSHNMVAVQTLCQWAIWLDAGQLKGQGAVGSIVTTYLRSGLAEDGSGERVWPDLVSAPGNETVRLHRIAVCPEGGSPDDAITMQTSVRIEVEYWNLLAAVHLHATLHVYNDQGIIAFTTGASLDQVLHVEPPTGLFRSVCHIPSNLLNSGFHRVSLLLVRSGTAATFKLDEAIGFEVLDHTEREYAWYGKEPGVLLPNLPWTTEYLGIDAREDVGRSYSKGVSDK